MTVRWLGQVLLLHGLSNRPLRASFSDSVICSYFCVFDSLDYSYKLTLLLIDISALSCRMLLATSIYWYARSSSQMKPTTCGIARGYSSGTSLEQSTVCA